jgi:hypothetical protein
MDTSIYGNVNNWGTFRVRPGYTAYVSDGNFSTRGRLDFPVNGDEVGNLDIFGNFTIRGNVRYPTGLTVEVDPRSVLVPTAADVHNIISWTGTLTNLVGTPSFGLVPNPRHSSIIGTYSWTLAVVNNPPVGASNTVTTPENTAYAFAEADFGFSDPNNSPANNFKAVEITTLPGGGGALKDDGVAVSAGQFVSVGDIIAGYLAYTPPTNTSGSGIDSFTFQVQNEGGTAYGGVDTDPTPRTMTINVVPTPAVASLSGPFHK